MYSIIPFHQSTIRSNRVTPCWTSSVFLPTRDVRKYLYSHVFKKRWIYYLVKIIQELSTVKQWQNIRFLRKKFGFYIINVPCLNTVQQEKIFNKYFQNSGENSLKHFFFSFESHKLHQWCKMSFGYVLYQSIPKLPITSRAFSRHFLFIFCQIAQYVDSVHGQIPNQLAHQKASNPLPSDHSIIFPCIKLFIQNVNILLNTAKIS